MSRTMAFALRVLIPTLMLLCFALPKELLAAGVCVP